MVVCLLCDAGTEGVRGVAGANDSRSHHLCQLWALCRRCPSETSELCPTHTQLDMNMTCAHNLTRTPNTHRHETHTLASSARRTRGWMLAADAVRDLSRRKAPLSSTRSRRLTSPSLLSSRCAPASDILVVTGREGHGGGDGGEGRRA
eukprot:2633463-Rhodomonas_salina.2